MFDSSKVVDTICNTEQLLAKFGNIDNYDIYAKNASLTLLLSDFIEMLKANNSRFDNCEFTITNYEEECTGIEIIDLRFYECQFNTNFEICIIAQNEDKVYLFDRCEFIANVSVSLFPDTHLSSTHVIPAIQITNCIIRNKLNVCGEAYIKTQFSICSCNINKLEVSDSFIILAGEDSEIDTIVVSGNGCSKISSLDCHKINIIDIDGYKSIQQDQKGGLLILRNTINDSYFEISHFKTMIFHNVIFGKGFKYNDLYEGAKNNDHYYNIYANNCNFKSYVDLSYMNYNALEFEESNFVGKFKLSESKADNLIFKGCKFSDSAKLYNFRKEISSASFSHSTINDLFIFNGWNGRTLDLSNKNTSVDFSNIYNTPLC